MTKSNWEKTQDAFIDADRKQAILTLMKKAKTNAKEEYEDALKNQEKIIKKVESGKAKWDEAEDASSEANKKEAVYGEIKGKYKEAEKNFDKALQKQIKALEAVEKEMSNGD